MALSKKIATGFIEIGVDDRRMASDMARVKSSTMAGFADIASTAALMLAELGVIAGIERLNMFGRQMAREAETARVALGLLIGSAEEGNKVFAELSKFSTSVPYSKNEVLKAAKALHAASIPAEEFVEKLKFLGDIASGSGKKLDEMVAIFAKIKNAGILTGEAFLELRKKSIDLGPALKRTLGVSNEELIKLLTNGQVTAEVVEKAFKNMTRGAGQFSGAMEKVSNTTEGLRGELFSKFAEAMIKLGESVKPIVDAFLKLGIVALDTFMALPAPIQTVLGLLLNLAPAIIAVSIAFKVMKLAGITSFKAIATAAWSLVASPAAPFVLIAAAIGLLLVVFVKLFTYLRSRAEPHLKRFAEAWGKIKYAFRVVGDAIMAVVSQILMSLGLLASALKIDDWQKWLDIVIWAMAEAANAIADFVVGVAEWTAVLIENWSIVWDAIVAGASFAMLAVEDIILNTIANLKADFLAVATAVSVSMVGIAKAMGQVFTEPQAALVNMTSAIDAMTKAFGARATTRTEGFSRETNAMFLKMNEEVAKLDAAKKDLESKRDRKKEGEGDEKGEPGKPQPPDGLGRRRQSSSAFVGLAEFSRELQNIANQDEQNGIPAQHLRATQRSIEIQQRQLKVIEDLQEQMKNQRPIPVAGAGGEFPL